MLALAKYVDGILTSGHLFLTDALVQQNCRFSIMFSR